MSSDHAIMDVQQQLVAYLTSPSRTNGRSTRLSVPDQHVAVVQQRRGLEVLPPGTYPLLNGWDRFLGRETPPVWLMPQGPIVLQPLVTNLLSYDRQMMEADMLIQARIADPVRLWQELVAGEVSLERRQVERELARRLQPVLSKHVRQYLPVVLQHQAHTVEDIQRACMPSLRAILESWGLDLLAVTHLGLRPALEVVEIRRQRQAIEQQLADLRLQGQIDELKRQEVLEYAKREMGLTDADEVRIQLLSQEQGQVEAIVQVLQERLDRLQSDVMQRLDSLAGTVSPAAPTRVNHDIAKADRLSDWVAVLRVIAAAIAFFFTVATIFFPHRFPDDTWPRLIVAGLGLLLALLALFASWMVHRQVHRHRRRAADRRARAAEQAELQQRVEQERGVRRYLEHRLREVSKNCDEIWHRVWDRGDQQLATEIRTHCSQRYAEMADKVQAADYRTSAYLSRPQVPLEDHLQMLAITQDVLSQVNAMVELSRRVYEAATQSPPDLDAVRRGCRELDNGRLAIANRFAEREQFLLR